MGIIIYMAQTVKLIAENGFQLSAPTRLEETNNGIKYIVYE
jgi:hypothetical protein